jgi:hypothetical protein
MQLVVLSCALLLLSCACLASASSPQDIGQRIQSQLQDAGICGFTDADGNSWDMSAIGNPTTDYTLDGTGSVANQKWHVFASNIFRIIRILFQSLISLIF